MLWFLVVVLGDCVFCGGVMFGFGCGLFLLDLLCWVLYSGFDMLSVVVCCSLCVVLFVFSLCRIVLFFVCLLCVCLFLACC